MNSIHTTNHSPPSPASISNTNTVGDYSHFNQKLSISDFDLLKVRYDDSLDLVHYYLIGSGQR